MLRLLTFNKGRAQRFINEQILYQTNMEAIIEKASSHISNDASPENMGNDWLLNFFDKCRTVSEDEMQELWARVLAGEAERPGNIFRADSKHPAKLRPANC